ncbi:MAG: SAM-dependent methyltransferase [Bacteroidia bacterium]
MSQLYIFPAPLVDKVTYWMYPYWTEVAQKVQHFFVEDRAHAIKILGKHVAHKVVFYEYQKRKKGWNTQQIQEAFRTKEVIGVLSDAGMAGIADPGTQIVMYAHELGYEVIPLVGPTSFALALAASGLSGERFYFAGYLPIRQGERRKVLKNFMPALKQGVTHIIMETPARNNDLLQDMIGVWPGDWYLCVASNLTASDGNVRTLPLARWKAFTLPKKPCVFVAATAWGTL